MKELISGLNLKDQMVYMSKVAMILHLRFWFLFKFLIANIPRFYCNIYLFQSFIKIFLCVQRRRGQLV